MSLFKKKPKKELEPLELAPERPKSIASAIMSKRKLAEGGEVMDSPEELDFDELNEDAAMHDLMEEDTVDIHQPVDSNEHGVTLEDADANDRSLISKIRARMKARRGI